MTSEGQFNICFTLVFFAVVGVIGFAWMSILLGILFAPPTSILYIASGILGPLLFIGWIALVVSRGDNTLVEMTISGSLPLGPVAVLAALDHWTSLSLVWSVPIALTLGLPAGLLMGLFAVTIVGGVVYFLWRIGCFFLPFLKPASPPPVADPDFDPDDISRLLRRPDDPDRECHKDGCHEPIVKFTRLCRNHLQQSEKKVRENNE